MATALDRGAIGIHVNRELYCYVEGQPKALELAAKLRAADASAIITAEDYRGKTYNYDNRSGMFELYGGNISAMLGVKPSDDDGFERTSISKKRLYESYIISTRAFGDNDVRGEILAVDYYDERPDFPSIVGTEYVPSIVILDNTVAKFEGEDLPSMEYFNNKFVHEFRASDTFDDAEQRLIHWAIGHSGSIESDRTGA